MLADLLLLHRALLHPALLHRALLCLYIHRACAAAAADAWANIGFTAPREVLKAELVERMRQAYVYANSLSRQQAGDLCGVLAEVSVHDLEHRGVIVTSGCPAGVGRARASNGWWVFCLIITRGCRVVGDFRALMPSLESSAPPPPYDTPMPADTRSVGGPVVDVRFRASVLACNECGRAPATMKRCAGCKTVAYCDLRCSHAHWATHKAWCKTVRCARAIAAGTKG